MEIVASSAESVRATRQPWQQAMRDAFRDVGELGRALHLPADLLDRFVERNPRFPLFVPREFAAKMGRGDASDPLLLQVLPLQDELLSQPGFSEDPVGDLQAQLTASLLQKYHGRVLLVATGACAIHCRYCFRQNFPYHHGTAPERRAAALAAIQADSSIEEVILSGGDPLTLADSQLAELARSLAEIPHVRRLRIHTRLPIVIPQRVTAELLDWIRGSRLTPLMVIHANHPRELDRPVAEALGKLADAGIPLLNQTVLLRKINDDIEVLTALSQRLIDLRVIPYYLHQLDRVHGTAHFEVPVARGLQLIEEMRSRLPGYAVPRYVQETPGDIGKSWL